MTRSSAFRFSWTAMIVLAVTVSSVSCGPRSHSATDGGPDAGDHEPGDAGGDAGGGDDGCPFDDPAQESSEPCVWPNAISSANSDPWIAKNHDRLEQMRPRFLVINFANGIGVGGNDEVVAGTAPTEAELQSKAESFLGGLREASRHQPRKSGDVRPFLDPELVRVVDLQDDNGHANSDAFPRGQLIPNTPGYRTVGYYELFSEAYAPYWGFEEGGRDLTLGEIVDRGLVHEVIMIANQVDGREPNPPAEVTSNILEVAFVAQAYTEDFQQRPGEFVKNGIPFQRQKEDMASATFEDHNSMPWTGRSLRIYFLNYSRGAGCLMHSLGHEFEFRYNESRIYSPGSPYHEASPHPWMQPLFRRYAGFDLDTTYGAPFSSLYAGGNEYSYSDCDSQGVCDALETPEVLINGYRVGCGNVHYPPGAASGYDYQPDDAVRSFCETFQSPDEVAAPISTDNWSYVTSDPAIDGDCGGKFLVYWFQNMPGLDTEAVDLDGQPMKNWWPLMYY